MTVTIALAPIANTQYKYPFWFTNDGLIHLGGEKDSVEIALEDLSQNQLSQIKLGLQKGQITVSDEQALLTALEAFTQTSEVIEEKQTVKGPITQEDIQDIKKKSLKEEAESLLTKSAQELSEIVGSGDLSESEIFEQILPSGIVELPLLEEMHSLEKAKKKKARKAVVTMIEKRIEAIKKIGIQIIADGIEDVVEEDHKKIAYNKDSNTFDEVE